MLNTDRKSLLARQTSVALLSTCAALAFSLPAYAEAPASSATQVDEVIVTAQKRSENIQDVPISIVAVTAEAAQRSGIRTTDDLGAISAGLTITRVTQSPLVYIRGVGTQSASTGEEGSNPIYVDGYYNPSLAGSVLALNNIERVEVLKGPQGTLFGRNATGGAINIITRDPQQTPTMSGSAGYGNFNTFEGSFYGSTGLGPNLAADLAVYGKDQSDGWGTNLATGQEVLKSKDFAVRGKVLFTPDDATRFVIGADYEKDESDYGIALRQLPGALSIILRESAPADFYDVRENLQPTSSVRQWGVNLKATHDFAWLQAVSLSNYRHVDADYNFDQDGSTLPLVDAYFLSTTQVFTQELQVQSLPDSKIKWIVGGFFLDSSANSDPLLLSGLAFAGVGGTDTRFGKIDTRSLAAYAQTTIPIGAQSEITAGLRYTHDRKELIGTDIIPALPTFTIDTDASWSKLTWRLSASHHFSDNVMVYASSSRGYKSGNFTTVNLRNPPVSPEELTAYEAGFKSEFADRRLQLNAAVYHYDYKNIQLNQLVAGQQFLLNAAAAKITGLDLEMQAAPAQGLKLFATANFMFKHEYSDFPGSPSNVPNPASVGGNHSIFIDATGNTLIRSPDFTGTLGASYDIPIGDGKAIQLSAAYVYSSSFFWEPDNRLKQNAYGLANGQIAYSAKDDRWRVRLWGRNLFDKKYYSFETSSIADDGSPAAPRTVGIALDVSY
jgi:iron complex outermembrane receptor protein